mgnify:CR=1 FL=1
MKNYFFLISLIIVSACSENEQEKKEKVIEKNQKTSIEELKKQISNYEDTLVSLNKNHIIQNLHYIEYFNRLTKFYECYPEDDYAQYCLFKIASTNTGHEPGDPKHLDIQEKYADTLLIKYPNFKEKKLLLEGLIAGLDFNNVFRDTSKIRFYYNQILKIKNLDKAYIKQTKKRLKHLDLNAIDFIEKYN